MQNPRDLYTRTTQAESLEQVPVLVHAFQGAFDAGHAGEQAADHLIANLPGERVINFHIDQLMDYRSRRPAMMFENGTFASYETPELVIDVLRDDEGVPLLLLHGPEPDLRWEQFVASVRTIIEDFGVELTIGVHGIPMGVPHTRPMTVTAHATRSELIEDHSNFIGSVQVPASMTSLLEFRLGEEGRDAAGIAANVPHYLAQAEYPQAAAELVRQIARTSGLSLPVGDLEAAGAKILDEIERQVGESSEVTAVVHALERNFDDYAEKAVESGRPPLPAGSASVPSPDDIAAQVEAFLAGQDDGEDSDGSAGSAASGEAGHASSAGSVSEGSAEGSAEGTEAHQAEGDVDDGTSGDGADDDGDLRG